MKIILTKQELDGFKKTRDCEHIKCQSFSCCYCPFAELHTKDNQEQDKWLADNCISIDI